MAYAFRGQSRIRTGFTLDIYGILIGPESPYKVGTSRKTIGNAQKIVKRGVIDIRSRG